jgi:hypothetical protein
MTVPFQGQVLVIRQPFEALAWYEVPFRGIQWGGI